MEGALRLEASNEAGQAGLPRNRGVGNVQQSHVQAVRKANVVGMWRTY